MRKIYKLFYRQTKTINPVSFKNIKIADYLYHLPDERIAQYPLAERDSSKLLICNKTKIEESIFNKIDDYIPSDSLIVFNNTKVIPARLFFYKELGAKIEIFCLEPVSDTTDYQIEFHKKEKSEWKCFVGNASKWKNGKVKSTFNLFGKDFEITAEKKDKITDEYIIEFNWNANDITFGEIIESFGKVPLPPYIKRDSEPSDKDKYQTVYAEIDGSVAAPTAGLHFTDDIFKKLKLKNCKFDYLTLNVGAGTFKPVKSKTIGEHKMHSELFCVSDALLKNILKYKDKKITAIGTTSLRTLESVYWFGVKLCKNKSSDFFIEQWYPYENEKISMEDSINEVLRYMDNNKLNHIYGNTELMVIPGYNFKIVDLLLTNFHLPGSTLLLLIAAFIGDDWNKIYNYALKNDFRFLSYGDSSLLIRE
ncbi:MAG: S-adenosylmethionine:tRNA ribosyltransferase-isomerase [Ignavibacteriae bacterium]|nr:S-adenosylmethionine:tRNA ribosyltransferase-isomerase [Ignavibacteriota bacterium]